jgi:hypothetical protein
MARDSYSTNPSSSWAFVSASSSVVHTLTADGSRHAHNVWNLAEGLLLQERCALVFAVGHVDGNKLKWDALLLGDEPDKARGGGSSSATVYFQYHSRSGGRSGFLRVEGYNGDTEDSALSLQETMRSFIPIPLPKEVEACPNL